ncbi:MAG: hypothetical protein HY673_18385 [Chloroflexi bacterium]|nr:hypothetical protein [Chloroflexota bacterium]
MLSSRETAGNVRLIVEADTAQTEVFVVDGRFRRVAKGLGRLDAELPPGLYDVKFKAGSAIKVVPIALEPGRKEAEVIRGPRMDFSSAAPLDATRTTREYHRHYANRLSNEVHHRAGDGSGLFVFARDPEVQGVVNTLSGLTLHDLSGKMLVDFAAAGVTSARTGDSPNPWGGCSVVVNPGSYRLRVRLSDKESLEQVIATSDHWQTQVFLTLGAYVPGTPERYPDLTGASVFMTRPGMGFNPGGEELRWTELARQGLLNRRSVVSKRDLDEMLWAKFENPMFGIYGAHLLLLAPDPDMRLLETVTGNLYSLVGDHPDVRALKIYADSRSAKSGSQVPYTAPPMLRSSWDIIVDATTTRPELVPLSSLAAEISFRLRGRSLWLIWLRDWEKDIPAPPPATQPAGTDGLASGENWPMREPETGRLPRAIDIDEPLAIKIALKVQDSSAEEVAEKAKLAPVEQDLLRYIAEIVRGSFRVTDATAKLVLAPGGRFRLRTGRPGEERLAPAAIVRSLGVPDSVASAAVRGLVAKLGLSQ